MSINKVDDLFVYADWDGKNITLYPNTMKANDEREEDIPQICIDKITHETLHGVIDASLPDYEGDHWPFLNGMDDSYVEDINSSLE